ncbi:hypothetical protein ABMY20_13670 [Tenacibaculum sp. SSH1-16]|uniref:hypothetical protein n=1 Tax=Tenacibaculum sp. SSH1-16 TaxID=3136667 RepID=UPI0032C43B98
MKKKKLNIEKFRVVRLEKPSNIFGGNVNRMSVPRGTQTETVIDDDPIKTINY